MGAPELMIILVIVVLLFGASKLPDLGRSLGEGLSNFKRGLKDGEDGPTKASPPEALPPARTAPRVEEPARAEAPVAAPKDREDV